MYPSDVPMTHDTCAPRAPFFFKSAAALCVAGLLLAGCGGGGGSSAPQQASAQPARTQPLTGDGAVTAAVPIVALPASGDCGPAGMPVRTSPANSTLDCAP